MSYQELKQYFLSHRYDELTFPAYLERRRNQNRTIITQVGDPDFDIKIQEAINQKLQARKIF